jgi:non-heme chloroperoxidase
MPHIKTSSNTADADVSIYYEEYGKGKPVVLIHGWPLCLEMWEYQVAELGLKGQRLIAYDRRGFGKSSRPWGGYDYDTLAEDLHALLEQLNLEDVTLVGFSMGGGEVARYLSRYGNGRVKKAVLISTVLPYMEKKDDNPDGVDPSVFEEMLTGLKKDRPAFLENFSKMFYGVGLVKRPVSTAFLNYNQTLAMLASGHATEECAVAFAKTDFRKDLAAIKIPTLVIHGDADKTVPIEASSNRTSKAIPQAQYLVYEGAPHGLFVTERDRLNADLLEFLQS